MNKHFILKQKNLMSDIEMCKKCLMELAINETCSSTGMPRYTLGYWQISKNLTKYSFNDSIEK